MRLDHSPNDTMHTVYCSYDKEEASMGIAQETKLWNEHREVILADSNILGYQLLRLHLGQDILEG